MYIYMNNQFAPLIVSGRRQAITWTNGGDNGNKFQWYLNRNCTIFIQENPFENVVR